MRKIAIVTCALILSACDNGKEIDTSTPATSVAAAPLRTFTKEQWQAAFLTAFEQSSIKQGDNGVTESVACFEKSSDGKCATPMFVKSDSFQKLHAFTPTETKINNIADIYTNVRVYVSIKECNEPLIIISPAVNKKGGWLFMKSIGFMADNEVQTQRAFEFNDVSREQDYPWVNEKAYFVPNEQELGKLRNFASGKARIIRISGEKGFLTVEKRLTEAFTNDLATAVSAASKLSDVLRKAGGPTCT